MCVWWGVRDHGGELQEKRNAVTALETLSGGNKTEELSGFMKLGFSSGLQQKAQLLTSCSVTNN